MSTFVYLIVFLFVFGIPALMHSCVPALVAFYRAHHLFGAAPDLAQGDVLAIVFCYILVATSFLFAWAMRLAGDWIANYVKQARKELKLAKASQAKVLNHG